MVVILKVHCFPYSFPPIHDDLPNGVICNIVIYVVDTDLYCNMIRIVQITLMLLI